MALGDLLDKFAAVLSLSHRVDKLEANISKIADKLEDQALKIVRLEARIELIKAEVKSEFFKEMSEVMARKQSPPRKSLKEASPQGKSF